MAHATLRTEEGADSEDDGFTLTSSLRTRDVEGPGKKIVEDELKKHKAADENSLQTKEEATFQKSELPLIKQIQEMFNTNAWSRFLEKNSVKALVHTVTLPNGELLTQTTYRGILDTLVPEVMIFEKTRILICSRKVDASIDKEFMRENVAKSTKISAGIGLSMGGSTVDFQPVEGDSAFGQGLPIRAQANGPGISFNGEMLKTYHRLTIRASLRMTVGVSKYNVDVIPRVP